MGLLPDSHTFVPRFSRQKNIVNKALEKTGQFGHMSLQTDQAEHSIEMHLPYVYKVFEKHVDKVTIVPILVGALTESTERQYGKLLAPYMKDPENLFIISSDFCHWYGNTCSMRKGDNHASQLQIRRCVKLFASTTACSMHRCMG